MLARSGFLWTALFAVQFAEVDSCVINLASQGINSISLSASLSAAYITCPADECTKLSLQSNAIVVLPAGIFDSLTVLQELHLWDNDIVELTAGVFDSLTSLKSLFLWDNAIVVLPAGIFDSLTVLVNLHLYRNDIVEFPAGIFDSLTVLDNLSLSQLPIVALPAGIFDYTTRLRVLYIYYTDIVEFPAGIFDSLTILKDLRLTGNAIVTLQAGIFDSLTALQILYLHDNAIVGLPAGIFDSLTALKTLYLYDNAIVVLAAGIFDSLTVLHDLRLYGNDIVELEAGVFDLLTSVKILKLEGNDLVVLPAGIFDSLRPWTLTLDSPPACSSGSSTAGPGHCFEDSQGQTYIVDDSITEYSDVNECETGIHNCADLVATCTNTIPGFDCECVPGYGGDGVTCVATVSPTTSPTTTPTVSPTTSPTTTTCDTHTCTDGTLKSSPESFTGADDATCCDVCDLRVDSDDIEKTWMSEYTISDGVVTVNVQEELEWIIENEKPTLTGQMVACISGFAWSYAVEGCDYREWTGTIGINALLQCSSGVAEDVSVVDGPDISRMRVEFEMSSLRNVEYYMAGVGDPTSIITTRNTLMPMLFDFQKTINVESQNIAVTSMYFPVTEVVATLTGSDDGEPLTDDEKDEITNSIAAHFNFPSAAIKFTFAESGSIVVTAQVPSDVSTTCAALTFTSFSAVVECAVGEDFASIREVTERSVISVGWTEGSISGLTAEANLKVYTNMQVPYELVNPQHKNQNSALTYSAFETTGTCSLNVDCEKYFEWTLTDDHASPVCTFSGSYEVEFDVVCSQEYNGYVCPLVGNETITTTVSLESGYHCPDTENAVDIALLATELFSNRVDSDDSETVTDSFLNTQTLKFHADVRADNAGLKDAKFIAISIADVNGGVDLELYNGGLTDSGTLLALAVTDIIDSSTDPESDSSVLSPSFTLIADADTLGLDLQETAVFQVTATIAAVYEADGVRRRALLQVSYDASTETSRTVIISAEDAAMQVLEESAAHNSVSAGLWLALLSVYTAFALHF